jgi:hypothetical protein
MGIFLFFRFLALRNAFEKIAPAIIVSIPWYYIFTDHMKVLLYAFGHNSNISVRTMFQIISLIPLVHDVIPVRIPRNGSLDSLLLEITEKIPDIVVGLGSYRPNAQSIRIETRFKNRYGTSTIIPDAPETLTNEHPLPPCPPFAIGEKSGNGPCNRSGFCVKHVLNTMPSETKFLFFHISPKFDPKFCAENILKLIDLAD